MAVSVSVPLPCLTRPPPGLLLSSRMPAKVVELAVPTSGSCCRAGPSSRRRRQVLDGASPLAAEMSNCAPAPARLSAARLGDAAVVRQGEQTAGHDRGRAGVGVDAAQVLPARRGDDQPPPVPPAMPPSWITPLKNEPLVMVSVFEPRLTRPSPEQAGDRGARVGLRDIERGAGAREADEGGTGDRAVALQRQGGAGVDLRGVDVGVDARQGLRAAGDLRPPAAVLMAPENSVEALKMNSRVAACPAAPCRRRPAC